MIYEKTNALAQWIDSRLNPILVKDIRRWLRSKRFMTIFFAAMTVVQITTIGCIYEESNGKTLFSILSVGLGFVLGGLVPVLMCERFSEELINRSTELALISRMTPGQLVRGKIMSGLAAMLLFFAAAGPSLMIAYMIGGVDIKVVLMSITMLLISASASMIFAILLATLTGARRIKIVGVLLIGAGIITASGQAILIDEGGRYLANDVWMLFMAGGYSLLGVFFFYVAATARLSFPADNRDTMPRLALSLLTGAVFVGMTIAAGSSSVISWSQGVEIGTGSAMMVFLFGFLFIMNTPDNPSSRIKRSWPRFFLWGMFMYPGPGRLWAYFLAHMVVFLTASIFAALYYGQIEEEIWMSLGMVVIAATLVSGSSLVHYALKMTKLGQRIHLPRGGIVFSVGATWCLLGLFVQSFTGFNMGTEALVSPITALFYLENGSTNLGKFTSVAVAMSIVGVPSMIYWSRDILHAVAEGRQIAKTRK